MALSGIQQKQLEAFGANMRRERLAQGITQERLAELVDLNIRTVQKIEAGEVNILFTTMVRIHLALGFSTGDLMNGCISPFGKATP